MAFKKLHPQIQKALEICGYTQPTPVQNEAIPAILDGNDIVASAQTGSGKTAAFVLPSLHLLATNKLEGKPSVLILTPTRELATQIMTAARKYGSQVRFNIINLVGGMSYEPQIRDLKRGADIIVATPGRLIDHLENKRVNLSNVRMLVLDEADRMLDMGFIEDVEKIASMTPKDRQTLLFSATVDKSIIQVVKRLLKDPVHIDLSKEKISTPKIKQTVYKAKNMQHKSRMLKHFLNDENIYKAIIFTATKTLADKLANELRGDGFAAAPLHGDLRQNVRNRTIEAFRRNKVQFLIATDVAARGLDIHDISHVINFDLPKFSEDYVHRIGRTGRAGKTGEAISFCSSTDLKHLQRIERYIGQRLNMQQDKFEYADTEKNTRSDADKYSPDDMMPPAQGGRGRGGRGGEKRSFRDRDRTARFEKSDKPFRRDREEGKSSKRFETKEAASDQAFEKAKKLYEEYESLFGESPKKKRNEDQEFKSFDKPKKHADRDEFKSSKPFDKSKKRFDREEKFDRSEQKPRRFDDKRSSFDKPKERTGREAYKASRSFSKSKARFDGDESRSERSFKKPGNRFERDDSRAGKPFDKSKKRFDRDDSRSGKPFDKSKRRFDRDESNSDRPFRKPGNRFDRDDARSGKPFDRSKKRFDRDESSSDRPFRKPGNRFERDDRPQRRFDRDESSARKPFHKKGSKDFSRRESPFERPVYEFERRDDNPKVLYKKRTDKPGKSRSANADFGRGRERPKTSGKFTKKPFRDTKKRDK